MEPCLKVQEVMHLLGLKSRQTIAAMIRRGELRRVEFRATRALRISAKSVERLIGRAA